MTRYALHPQVGLRDESFGALAYHYGNRRLTFVNDRRLVEAIRSAAEHDDVEAALAAAGVAPAERPAFRLALDRLADAEVVVRS
jgi:putative mycofactocin binding protein MftB